MKIVFIHKLNGTPDWGVYHIFDADGEFLGDFRGTEASAKTLAAAMGATLEVAS